MERYSVLFAELPAKAKLNAIAETRADHELSSLMSDEEVINYIKEIGMYFDEDGSRND